MAQITAGNFNNVNTWASRFFFPLIDTCTAYIRANTPEKDVTVVALEGSIVREMSL